MSVINCTHYIDHEEAPLSQMRTVGLCGYTVNNSPSVVLNCHLLAQLCNLENNLFYIVIMRKIRRGNEKKHFLCRDHETIKSLICVSDIKTTFIKKYFIRIIYLQIRLCQLRCIFVDTCNQQGQQKNVLS